MQQPAQPDLYVDSDPLRLFGSRCAECGRVSFPAMTLGCDGCGAPDEQLEPIDLVPAGVVHSLATVYLHHGQPAAPFSVAEVRLDGGPLIRVMLAPEAGEVHVGERVRGVLRVSRTDDDGNDLVEPAFIGEAS